MCAWVWHWECLRLLWVLTYRDTRGVQWVYVYLCHTLPNHNPSTYVLNCTDTPIPHQTSPTPQSQTRALQPHTFQSHCEQPAHTPHRPTRTYTQAQSPQCLTHTRVQAITRRHTHAHRPPAHTQRWNPLDSPLPALRASPYTPTLNFYGWRTDPMEWKQGPHEPAHEPPAWAGSVQRDPGGRGMGSPTGDGQPHGACLLRSPGHIPACSRGLLFPCSLMIKILLNRPQRLLSSSFFFFFYKNQNQQMRMGTL